MKKIILLILSLIFVVGLYIFTIKGSGGNIDSKNLNNLSSIAGTAYESSHERANIAETISLIENKSFILSNALGNFGAPDVGIYKNNFYSLFPPGVSVSVIPMYLLGARYGLSQVFSYATISVFAILSLLVLYKISRNIFKLSTSISLFTSLMFGFSSFAWAYSITIYQHIPTAFLLLTAFYSAWKLKNSKRIPFIWGIISWLTIGLSIFFDYPNAFLMVPIVFYLASNIFNIEKIEEKIKLYINLNIILSAIAFLLTIGLYLFFSYSVYGKITTTNTIHRYDLNDTTSLTTTAESNLSNTFQESKVFNGLYLLTIAPEKGMFVFAPILVLSLLGILYVIKKPNPEKWLLIAIPTINFLVYASFGDPWGGWAFGPRYLIPSVPFLVILVGIWMQEKGRTNIKKLIAFILFVVSSAIAVGGALTTNLLPPKVEAVYLHLLYGLNVTWNNILANQSSSYVYNTYFSHKISLLNYGLILFAVINIAAIIVLFVIPKIYKENV